MPLRCIDALSGMTIHAFDIEPADWRQLSESNRRSKHLKMPCCESEVTLRRSSRGTQFFAHKAIGNCVTAPESEAHLRLKALAVQAARKLGWDAETEVCGTTPSGEAWTADVLATKGKAKVAVEVQWSPQTEEETVRRQGRYTSSGVRALWLMRRFAAPICEAVPAARISRDAEGSFVAHLPTLSNDQALSVEDFLCAAFGGRLKFGLPIGALARLSVKLGKAPCWKCGAFTEIICGLAVGVGPHEFDFSVADTEDCLDLFEPIYRRLETERGIGRIKRRYSRTQGRAYLSNGCAHCDVLFGQFHEFDASDDRETIVAAELPLDERWRRVLLEDDQAIGWGVFDFAAPNAAENT